MHQIIYTSKAAPQLATTGLIAILEQARWFNEANGITGALVYGEDHFTQVLEGEETVVQRLYERIARDARHQAVRKVADKAIAARTFPNWSMAFRELSAQQAAEIVSCVSSAQGEQMPDLGAPADERLLTHLQELVLTHGAKENKQ